MKNHFNKCLFVCVLVVSCLFASCDKEDDRQSFEAVGRIASYYGVAHGEGAFKVMNVLCGGEWVHWPQVKGLDYEEGYEYEVKVRMDYRKELEGMADVLFLYDVTCLEVISKEARHTDDCPLMGWDEYAESEGVGAE